MAASLLVMTVCAFSVVPHSLVGGSDIDPRLPAFAVDYSRHQKWNYITIVYQEESVTMADRRMLRVLYKRLSSVAQVTVTKLQANQDTSDMETPNKNPEYRMQFVMIWKGESLADYMKKAGEQRLFTKKQEWLVCLGPETDLPMFKNSFQSVDAFIDSEVIAIQGSQEGPITLTEVWGVGDGVHVRQGAVGRWSISNGLQKLQLEHKYDRRKDLMGALMRVSTIKSMPYVSLTVDDSEQNFKVGYVVDVWHTLQEQLNFTYRARHTLFGSLQEDKVTWNGMVGDLQMKSADAAVAPLSITKIRSKAIDFTLPIQMVSTRLYIRRPVLEASWELYSLPFDSMLWICVPCGVIFASVSVWFLNKLANWAGVTKYEFSSGEAFWTLFSGLVQQAAILVPDPFSGRLMLFAGYWTSMILFTCYSATLVSILATMQPMLPFEDFEGLLAKPDWDLGVRTNTALADSLALAPKDSPMRLSWEKHVLKNQATNLPKNNDDALASVLKGEYAFFANKEYIIYRLQDILPIDVAMNIVDTGKDFLVRGIGFGLQKNSPYRNLFNHVLSKMSQTGHIQRLKVKWWPNIKRDPPKTYPTPGFNEVFTVFMIWGIGVLLAVTFLVAERLLKKIPDTHQGFLPPRWGSGKA